ncbi:MAG: serine protease [Bacteriovoracaceae bacterium]
MKFLISSLLMLSAAFGHVNSGQIIYGEDNRMDIEQVRSAQIQKVAKSVAARVSNRAFHIQDKEFSLGMAPLLSDQWGAAVCQDEKFANQPTVSDCSGFLVGEDLLATAGHCVLDMMGEVEDQMTGSCAENSWMFDYVADKDQVKTERISVDNLYSCSKVVYAVVDDVSDFALIKLDRKVSGREPVKIRKEAKVKSGEGIFVIGYPSGLPLKYAGGAKVFENDKDEYFSTNLDTFGGNSGSPIFNAQTYQVEGILVRGRTDYVDSELDGKYCRRVNICDESREDCLMNDAAIDGEHVNRIAPILNYL